MHIERARLCVCACNAHSVACAVMDVEKATNCYHFNYFRNVRFWWSSTVYHCTGCMPPQDIVIYFTFTTFSGMCLKSHYINTLTSNTEIQYWWWCDVIVKRAQRQRKKYPCLLLMQTFVVCKQMNRWYTAHVRVFYQKLIDCHAAFNFKMLIVGLRFALSILHLLRYSFTFCKPVNATIPSTVYLFIYLFI